MNIWKETVTACLRVHLTNTIPELYKWISAAMKKYCRKIVNCTLDEGVLVQLVEPVIR
jgi:hypothetical protein